MEAIKNNTSNNKIVLWITENLEKTQSSNSVTTVVLLLKNLEKISFLDCPLITGAFQYFFPFISMKILKKRFAFSAGDFQNQLCI